MRKYQLYINTEKNKLLLFLFLSIVLSKGLSAQIYNPDSLKSVVANTKKDTAKIEALTHLADYYSDFNSDSEYHYASLLKEVALKVKNRSAEGYAILDMGESFMRKGNNIQALTLDYDALKIFKELKDSINIATTYNNMGNLYLGQRDFNTAIKYYRMTLQLATQVGDFRDEVYGALNIGTVYNILNQLDSALHYQNLALDVFDKHHVNYSRAILLLSLADTHSKLHQNNIARKLINEAIENSIRTGDQHLAQAQLTLAYQLLQLNKFDSALIYANEAKQFLEKNDNLSGRDYLYRFLAKIYEGKGQYDMAYLYQGKRIETSDSLYNINQANQVANLSFNEHQHEIDMQNAAIAYQNKLKLYGALSVLTLAVISLFFLFSRNKKQQKANKLLQQQKQQIQETLAELKSTQAQLIQSEKMASLGELTAGIAHEIQNPLNFVNNFSEVSNELLDEMNEELDKSDIEEAKAIAADIKQNLVKINHHGKRADSIVKGMLEHSRTSKGEKQLTNLNALAEEYLRLAYHGLRAKDKSFNTEFQTHFDESIDKINIVPQDIGRVLLNLFNNACYAVNDKKKQLNGTFEPLVSVTTAKQNGSIILNVTDNGNGIPQNIIDKIFQPFFTTKPTGHGTGLGLSLSYDIIKAHGGKIKVESKEGEGSVFSIELPS